MDADDVIGDTGDVCEFTSIHREVFIFLEHLKCQETDQRCVEDVSFLCQVPSSLL